MNRHALSRAFRLAGWEGGERGEAQRVIGAVSVSLEDTCGREQRGEYNRKSPGSVPRTPEIEAEGRRRESW